MIEYVTLLERQIKPFILPFMPSNREQRRKMLFECRRVNESIMAIENFFLTHLFEGTHDTYNDLYAICLDMFKVLIEREQKQFKYVRMNEYYFADCFKPLEGIN